VVTDGQVLQRRRDAEEEAFIAVLAADGKYAWAEGPSIPPAKGAALEE
jgi:hypothetical protein